MKFSKLLVLSALALMGLSANAADLVERTEPEQPAFGPGLLEVDNFEATPADFVVGDCYVIYNVGAQAYFSEGNAWGTQASISSDDAGTRPLMVRFTLPEGKTLDDATLIFNDYPNSKDSWKLVFFDNATQMFVDRGSQANYFWQVVAGNGSKTYRLQASPSNPDYNPTTNPGFVGLDVTADETNTALSPFLEEGEGHYIDWQFYPIPEWTSYFKEKDIFDLAAKLKKQIEIAEAGGYDVADAVAVYNNLSSTLEQIQAAIDTLKSRMAEGITKGTADNPSDATVLINNPNFDNASYAGWLGTAPNMAGSGAHGPANVPEHYNKNFDTYQELAELPDGVYCMNLSTFFRGTLADYLAGSNQQYYPYLYATVGEETFKTLFNNAWSAMNTEALGGDTEWGVTASESTGELNGTTYYIPNDPSAFRVYAEKGFYDTTLFFEVQGGKVRIGVKKDELQTGTDWAVFDTFRLRYFGNTADSYQKWVELSLPVFEIVDGTVYTDQYKEAYDAAVAGAKATNKAEALAAIENVKAVLAELQKNIGLWQKLQAKMDQAVSMAIDSKYDGLLSTELLGDYIMELEEIIGDQALTNEELEAEIAKVDEMMEAVKKEFSEQVEPGTDMTDLLTNPDFEFGLSDGQAEGWTVDVSDRSGGNITPGPLGSGNDQKMIDAIGKVNHCFESWHVHGFDVWQEIKSAPAGVYQISVQGYVRGEFSGYTQGDEIDPAIIPIKLYMNSSQSNFPSVYSEEIAAEHYLEDGTLPVIEDHSWNGTVPNTPNSMGAASLCFAWGMYQVNTFGLVKPGEPMRVGVKGSMNDNWWCIWDNFKITYQGFLPEYVQPALESALAAIDLSKPMAKSLHETASALHAEAEEAIATGDGVKMFTVLTKVNDVIDAISTSVALFAKLQSENEALMELAAYCENATAKAEAQTLISEIENAITAGTLENEDAEAYIEKIKVMKSKLRQPAGMDAATDEKPVDATACIENPDFETGNADGWTHVFADVTNHGYQGASYTNEEDGTSITNFIEAWKNGAALGNGTVEQTIFALPEGVYTLEADVIASNQNGEVNEGLFLFAAEKDGAKSSIATQTASGQPKHYALTFKKASAESDLTIGLEALNSTANWLAADNFMLTYYGKSSAKDPDGDATGITTIATAGEQVKVEYFTLDGRKATSVQKGILIQKVTFENGSVMVRKIRK